MSGFLSISACAVGPNVFLCEAGAGWVGEGESLILPAQRVTTIGGRPVPSAKPYRLAATLMLLRRRHDPEVFWVQRAATTSFLSGYHAFPGGRVDPEDAGADDDARARVAAVRETEEETGYRPTTPLVFAAESLTPAYLGRRYRTRYYLTWCDQADPVVDPAQGELDAGAWIRPADALARWAAGEVLMAPPTLAALRALAAGQFDGGWHDPGFEGPPRSPIRPHLDVVPLRSPTLPPATHTNCVILGDDVLAVVDPASPFADQQAVLDAELDARVARGARVEAVVLTHHHHDHVGDAQRVAARYGARILAHPETAARLGFAVDGTLDEGDVLALGAERYAVLHTPGHAPGHLVLNHTQTGTLVVGDMVAGLGTILIEPGDGDMRLYLEQLARLRALAPTALIPAHGPIIGGADAVLTHYIRHRLAREAKVLAALEQGSADLKTLTERAYADAPAYTRMGADGGIAGRALAAHLDKLVLEGRARETAPNQWGAA